MKKLSTLFLSVLLALAVSSCSPESPASFSSQAETPTASSSNSKSKDKEGAIQLSFKSALSYEYLKSIDGQKVTINGYMATSSPVDGSFIFLMNLPYQSCPFCKPNTSMLSNTMEVYPKSGTKFSYTSSAIGIVGTLMVAADEKVPFSDPYGYEFNFKIVDSSYYIVDEEDLSPEMATWQDVASSNLISEIYDMLEYCNFLALWPTYYVNSYENIDGEVVPGFYLYAADALQFLKPGNQYGYGREDGYFDKLRNKAKKIDENQLKELIDIIDEAEELADDCYAALINEEYTCEYQYVPMFDTNDYIFTLNEQDVFEERINAIYDEFALWFSNWEL